jgi:glutamine amidotransferase
MIAIADYGLGNINAFANIFRELNAEFSVASDAATLAAADKIILPGVGAFDFAMQMLNGSGMADTLNECVLIKGKPVLGICVGMQMLGTSSEEGSESGLDWIPGRVRKIHFGDSHQQQLLPHMGWNTLTRATDNPLLKGLDDAFGFYFLHSYYFDCDQDVHRIASVGYGNEFPCAIQRDNVFGVQFHPEKSHHNGIRLLKNFAEI